MILSAADVLDVWEAGSARRREGALRRRYFGGSHVPEPLRQRRLDGRVKAQVITNWVRYAAEFHAGFLTAEPVQYLGAAGAGSEPGPLQEWQQWLEDGAVAARDQELLRDALLVGQGVEVATFEADAPGGVRLWRSDPGEWEFVRDSDGAVTAAVWHRELVPFSEWDGALLRNPLRVFRAYSAAGWRTYTLAVGDPTRRELVEVEEGENALGVLPVLVYEAAAGGQSLFSDAFLRQCDAYDETRSALVDDIRYNVDAWLVLEGVPLSKLLQADEDGRTAFEKARELGILPMAEGQKAQFLQRDTNVEKFRFDLMTTRQSLHVMAALPDLDDLIGGNDSTITNISGVALRLLFQPTVYKAAEVSRNFVRGLRARLDVWNAARGARSLEPAAVEKIRMRYAIPTNEMELVQYIPNLLRVMGEEDVVRLLPQVADPDGVARRRPAAPNDEG